MVRKMFDEEMLIKIFSTALLEIFCKNILYSKIIVKSIRDPGDNFLEELSISINGLRHGWKVPMSEVSLVTQFSSIITYWLVITFLQFVEHYLLLYFGNFSTQIPIQPLKVSVDEWTCLLNLCRTLHLSNCTCLKFGNGRKYNGGLSMANWVELW